MSQLFQVNRLPSYSTIRRVLLNMVTSDYSARLACFFEITPEAGETNGVDGKVLRGSFMVEQDNPHCDRHPAIMERECLLGRERINSQA
ncbi:MAG: hypothetical protein F6J94_07540 [Moorea sp. SIO1F2]|uniref:hypothetical protein n=1 Tax=Moorena sp. SIO1F2 TaxID=2607819 RepID=UPI0013BDC565|nr:hypothetical protein [Moorena sp. SIO1F2]NET81810.1 hypothetical protein [Moorena sp. SIO1F2]